MYDRVEFTMLPDGRILDLRPMYANNPALVYENGSWIIYNGSVKEMLESKPIERERIKDITSGTGIFH